MGATIGVNHKSLDDHTRKIAADPTAPTPDEITQAEEKAKEEFLAVYFIMTLDWARYGSLVERLEKDKLLNVGRGWPKTRQEAYETADE